MIHCVNFSITLNCLVVVKAKKLSRIRAYYVRVEVVYLNFCNIRLLSDDATTFKLYLNDKLSRIMLSKTADEPNNIFMYRMYKSVKIKNLSQSFSFHLEYKINLISLLDHSNKMNKYNR